MDLPSITRLYDHMEWADSVLWTAVLASDAAAADDYVLQGLTHVHLVQRAYLHVWHSREIRSVSPDDFGHAAEIRDWARTYYPEAREFLASLDADRAQETPAIPWIEFIERAIGGPPEAATVGDMVYQVPLHSVHHRAQINRRIRELEVEPPFLDYVAWVWWGCPRPVWEG